MKKILGVPTKSFGGGNRPITPPLDVYASMIKFAVGFVKLSGPVFEGLKAIPRLLFIKPPLKRP